LFNEERELHQELTQYFFYSPEEDIVEISKKLQARYNKLPLDEIISILHGYIILNQLKQYID